MCAGALVNARVDRLVFGARNLEAGAAGSLYHLGADPRLNHEFVTTATSGPTSARRCSPPSSPTGADLIRGDLRSPGSATDR